MRSSDAQWDVVSIALQVDSLATSINQWNGALAEILHFRTPGAETAIAEARETLTELQASVRDHGEAVRQLEAAAQKAADSVQLTEQLKRCAHMAYVLTQSVS